MRPLAAAVVLTCLPTAAIADPGLLLFPSIGLPAQVTVSGRVLSERPGGSTSVSRNLRRLLASNWEGAPVEVTLGSLQAKTVSRHDGMFEVTFSAPEGRPFAEGLLTYAVRVPGATERGKVEIASPSAPFLVISDFDDTLAVTNVVDKRKMVKSALFQEADTLPPVDGMSAWYRCMRSARRAAPPFALVSGSPVQYVPRTVAFLSRHDFPFFGLYLRDLGPGTLEGYKQPIIRSLLKQLPHPVVLVGDSGEHDPEVYAQIRAEFPGRVRAIYIRDAGRAERADRFHGMELFRTPRHAADDAVRRGLAERACVERAFAAGPAEAP